MVTFMDIKAYYNILIYVMFGFGAMATVWFFCVVFSHHASLHYPDLNNKFRPFLNKFTNLILLVSVILITVIISSVIIIRIFK